jgi:hypothetical protein
MSTQQGPTISPQAEAVLYFIGLIFVYVSSYSPSIAAPDVVRSIFGVIGVGVILVKYELAQVPKPQITSHQALYSFIALALSVAGGQISANYSTYWYAGLVVAIIGAILAAYQDLGGQVPPTAPTPAVPAT